MSDMSKNRAEGSGIKTIVVVVVLAAAFALAIALCVWFLTPALSSNGSTSMKNAIIQSANQCYAIEGAYPYSLDYLEDNYGLVVNHEDYRITYEVFADNVAPNVVVVQR